MKRWSWLIPVALAVILYLPTLRGEYVWDDSIVINRQILAFKDLGHVFFPPDHIPQWGQNYYRPVVVITYLLDNWLFGPQNPMGRHLTNIAIYGMVTFLVWLFALQCLQRFPKPGWGAVVAAGLFAAHPIHSESVSWITGRSDAVAALFMMACVVTAVHYWNQRAPWALLLAPLLYFLALLSKEVAFSTILVLPFILKYLMPLRAELPEKKPVLKKPSHNVKTKKQKSSKKATTTPHPAKEVAGGEIRGALLLCAPFLLVTVVYFVMRHQAIVGHGTALGLGFGELVGRGWRAMAYYVLKVVFPLPQLHFVSLQTLPSMVFSSLIIMFAATIVIVGSIKGIKSRPLIIFSLAWFLCTLAPSLPVAMAKISEAPVAERYLFLPSIGFALLLGGLFCLATKKISSNRILIVSACVPVVFYGAATAHRNGVWLDNVRLWTDAVLKSPGQGLPWTELGMAYQSKDDLEKALASFQKAVVSDYDNEGRSIAHNNMGMIYLRQKDREKAETHFRSAIGEREHYATPYYGLGLIGLTKAKESLRQDVSENVIEGAIINFKQAVKLNPSYVKALWGLTSAYAVLGDIQKKTRNAGLAMQTYRLAIQVYGQLTEIDPHFASRHPAKSQYMETLRSNLESMAH